MPRSFLVKKNAKQAASGLRKLQHGIATTAYNPAEGAGTAAYPEMSLTAPINIPHPVIHKPAPLQAIPNPTTASYWRPHHQPSHPQHHISSHYNKSSLYDSKNSLYDSKNSLYNSNNNQEIHQTHRFGNHQQQPHHPNLMYARAPLPVSPFEADTFPHIHKGYSPPPPFSQPLHAHLPQQSLQRLLTPTPTATPLIASDENRLLSPTHPHYPHHAHHNHHHHHPHHQQQQLPPSAALTVAAKPEKEVKRRKGAKSGEESTKYHCPDCGKEYSTFGGLSKHRQLHCDAQNKKTFNCKYCDKEYMSLGALKMHIRTHTLPCKCEFCGKAFSRPWLLQGHIRTHTGEKPFRCQHCQRAFADRSNLRAHLQTHSEVKKYSCKSCGKTFSRMSLLSKHEESGCMSSNSD